MLFRVSVPISVIDWPERICSAWPCWHTLHDFGGAYGEIVSSWSATPRAQFGSSHISGLMLPMFSLWYIIKSATGLAWTHGMDTWHGCMTWMHGMDTCCHHHKQNRANCAVTLEVYQVYWDSYSQIPRENSQSAASYMNVTGISEHIESQPLFVVVSFLLMILSHFLWCFLSHCSCWFPVYSSVQSFDNGVWAFTTEGALHLLLLISSLLHLDKVLYLVTSPHKLQEKRAGFQVPHPTVVWSAKW